MLPAYIPSPSQGVWHLGPIPLRAYAFCIILGVVAAVKVSEPRMAARGIPRTAVGDVAVVAVPIALVGSRVYNVITSWQPYFGKGGDPISVFEVWKGGLGVPGGVVCGVTSGWIWMRRKGYDPFKAADAVAPGIAVGQAIGRFGNYFNQELFGRPTTLPWGLKIEPGKVGTVPGAVAYQPTFLYELLWDLGNAGLLIYLGRKLHLKKGQTFALYVVFYAVGRGWIEYLRIDPANHILGLRVNDWVSMLSFLGGLIAFRMLGRRAPDADDLRALEVAPPEGTAPAEEPADAVVPAVAREHGPPE